MFYFFFTIQVTITLKKPVKGIESPFLDLNVSQLGINMTTRTYDLCATTYIQTISLRCLQFLGKCAARQFQHFASINLHLPY